MPSTNTPTAPTVPVATAPTVAVATASTVASSSRPNSDHHDASNHENQEVKPDEGQQDKVTGHGILEPAVLEQLVGGQLDDEDQIRCCQPTVEDIPGTEEENEVLTDPGIPCQEEQESAREDGQGGQPGAPGPGAEGEGVGDGSGEEEGDHSDEDGQEGRSCGGWEGGGEEEGEESAKGCGKEKETGAKEQPTLQHPSPAGQEEEEEQDQAGDGEGGGRAGLQEVLHGVQQVLQAGEEQGRVHQEDQEETDEDFPNSFLFHDVLLKCYDCCSLACLEDFVFFAECISAST